jgi:hypothetical protein
MKYQQTPSEPDHPKDTTAPVANSYSPEARCHCGQLVAKLSDDGIELKCKRCKRLILLPFSSLNSGKATINICENN